MFGKHEIEQAVLGSECILKLIGVTMNITDKLRKLKSRSRVVLRPELRTIEFLTSDNTIFELPPSYQRWYDEWAA